MRKVFSILAVVVVAVTLRASTPIQFVEVTWTDAPSNLPPGSKIAILEGDPRKEGIFTMRVKLPAGSRINPHSHPRPERVTVLWGEARLGFGERYDQQKTKRFPAGSFYINPPDTVHYVYFPRTTVLQMTGEGPWELHYVK